MRRIFVVMGALLLLVALAGAQSVIKYAVPIDQSDYSGAAIGEVVELNSEDSLVACDADTDAIGFIGMIESDGTNEWAVIVNAGVISATVHDDVSAGDSLTVDGSNPGDLKAAGVGDRVVAVALENISAGSSGNVLITGVGPIRGANQARIWQTAIDTMANISETSLGASAEIFDSDLTLNNCGVDSVKIQFTGTVDDRRGSGGAVIKVAISDGSGTIKGDSTVVYLVDLAFYQSASVVVTAVADVNPTDSPTYNVMAWCTNGLTNGRIRGILTVVGTP